MFLQYWKQAETQRKGYFWKGILTLGARASWKEFKAGARVVNVCCYSRQLPDLCSHVWETHTGLLMKLLKYHLGYLK